jgi:hypothetical protein
MFLIETLGRSSILEEIPQYIWKIPCDLPDINTHVCACAHNAGSTNSRKFDFVSHYKCKSTEEEKSMASKSYTRCPDSKKIYHVLPYVLTSQTEVSKGNVSENWIP